MQARCWCCEGGCRLADIVSCKKLGEAHSRERDDVKGECLQYGTGSRDLLDGLGNGVVDGATYLNCPLVAPLKASR